MDDALVKKLRLPAAGRVAVLEPPEGYLERLGLTGAAAGLEPGAAAEYDFVQVFAKDSADVARLAPDAVRAVKPDGLLWMCYPKGSSKVKTDINRDNGWRILQDAGWEAIALVSVDDTWSTLRFRPQAMVGSSRPSPAERRGQKSAAAPAAVLEMPADLRAALDAVPEAAAFYEKLAPSHKKEYLGWILEAKREETRQSRIQKMVEKLSKGLKRPSDKG